MYESKTVILTVGVMADKRLEGEEAFLGRGVSYCATCDGMLYQGKRIAVLCNTSKYEAEVEYLAGLASEVLYFPAFVPKVNRENVAFRKEEPVAVQGGKRVDGIFCLRNAIAPTAFIPGIAVEEGNIAVERTMATNLPGCFAAGDCTGRPHQYAKAVGEGNVAAHSVVSYLTGRL